MAPHRRPAGRRPVRAAAALALPLLLALPSLALVGAADPPAEALPVPGASAAAAVPAPQPLVLDLPAALHLALERQARIAMQRASLAASEDGQRALANLHVPDAIVHQMPYRRRQSALGVTAAAAGLDQAQHEVAYAVTRTYFTVQHAREQERLARSVVERLKAIHSAARAQLDAGAPNVESTDVDRTLVYLRLAEAKRVQATDGVKRALAAFKEAVGVEPELCIDVPDAPLPVPQATPCRADAIALALARRPEVIEASIFAEVVGLEIQAQAASSHRRVETFASGADVHANSVPQGTHNNDYEPGATPPQMPGSVAGNRCDRVQHVRDLHARAVAGIEQTRNLVVLDADNAFLKWEEASQQVPLAREAAETAEKIAGQQERALRTQQAKVEAVANARVLASQARVQYNDYLYHLILALADLERATAGGFCAGLVGAPAPERPAPGRATEGK